MERETGAHIRQMVLTGKKARKQLISRPLSGFDYALKKFFPQLHENGLPDRVMGEARSNTAIHGSARRNQIQEVNPAWNRSVWKN